MNGWENFFIAEVGASAALLGLIFVGVSIILLTLIEKHLPFYTNLNQTTTIA